MRSFSKAPLADLVVFLLLVVFILLLLTSFKTSESWPMPPQVGDCLSLLVLLERQRCGCLSSGTVVERVSSSLYQDLIPFLLALPIFSYGKLFSEGSSLMESRAVVLAPPC